MKKAGRRREIEPHCRPVDSSFMSGPCSSAHSDGMHSWFQRVWPLRTTDGGVLVIFRLSPDTSTGSSRSACKCVHSRTNEMSTAAKRFKWNAVKYILFFKKMKKCTFTFVSATSKNIWCRATNTNQLWCQSSQLQLEDSSHDRTSFEFQISPQRLLSNKFS